MKKRMKRLCCISACLCFCASALCTGCTAAFYSEEAHIRRVTERAEARFLGEGSAYTGLEVFPIYNEYEEFHYLLIELEPQGFLYVTVNDSLPLDWFGGAGMYILSDLEPMPWKPHRMVEREYIDSDGDLHSCMKKRIFRMRTARRSSVTRATSRQPGSKMSDGTFCACWTRTALTGE